MLLFTTIGKKFDLIIRSDSSSYPPYPSYLKALAKRSNIVGQTFPIANQAKYLTVWVPLLVKHLLLDTSIKCFWSFQMHCWVNSAWQEMFCDVVKRSKIVCKANLECLTNNVWSIDQALSLFGRLLFEVVYLWFKVFFLT